MYTSMVPLDDEPVKTDTPPCDIGERIPFDVNASPFSVTDTCTLSAIVYCAACSTILGYIDADPKNPFRAYLAHHVGCICKASDSMLYRLLMGDTDATHTCMSRLAGALVGVGALHKQAAEVALKQTPYLTRPDRIRAILLGREAQQHQQSQQTATAGR